jgi:hypothetical protein
LQFILNVSYFFYRSNILEVISPMRTPMNDAHDSQSVC